MNYLFDQLNKIATGILVILVVLCLIMVIVFLRSKKKRRVNIDEDGTDYSGFQRKDTKDYIKIDDIKDDMIVLDKGTRFVGVIKCHGFDFYSEDYAIQAATSQAYYGFINTITKPITYRQYSKPVDLEDTSDMYKQAYDSVISEIYMDQEELREIASQLKAGLEHMSQEDKSLYEKRIRELERQIEALRFRKFHLEDQMRIIANYSTGNILPDPVETYVFEWKYDPLDFSAELSDEEIYKRAVQELNSLANAKIHALSNCNVKAARCRTDELIEMCRFYSSPVSAARYKLRDIKKSSFFDDIVTSDSVQHLRELALEENHYKAQMEYMKNVRESIEEAAARAEKEFEDVYKAAMEEEEKLNKTELWNSKPAVADRKKDEKPSGDATQKSDSIRSDASEQGAKHRKKDMGKEAKVMEQAAKEEKEGIAWQMNHAIADIMIEEE